MLRYDKMPELESFSGHYDPELLKSLTRTMLSMRRFEERVLALFAEGKLNGTTHACIGQEAVEAGLISLLSSEDRVFSNHRCHGHYLAYSDDIAGLLAELTGRLGGVSQGLGGSQHLHAGNFYTNGVQGGIAPVAAGLALALQLRRGSRPSVCEANSAAFAESQALIAPESKVNSALEDNSPIAVVFLGDGTLGEGQVYETLNMASLWKLPLLFVVEHNYWAQSTPSWREIAGSIAERFRAFDVPVWETASQDVLQTRHVAAQAVRHCRAQQAPAALVFHTCRFCSHSKADDGRPLEAYAAWLNHDPLKIAAERLGSEMFAALDSQVQAKLQQIEQAVLARPLVEAKSVASEAKTSVGKLNAAAVESQLAAPSDDSPLREYEQACLHYQSLLKENGQPERLRTAKRLNLAMHALLGTSPQTVFLGEDILDPYGGAFKVAKGLSQTYPSQVITTPLSEASMTGIAGGLALAGQRPILEIMFGDFITLSIDQIYNYISKFRGMYNGVDQLPLVIRAAMGGRRGYGPTHSQTLDRLLLGIPDVKVVAPHLGCDAGKLLINAVYDGGPVIFIENKLLYARVPLTSDSDGYMGNWQCQTSQLEAYPTLRLSLNGFERAHCCVAVYGGMTEIAMRACEQLFIEEEIACELLVPSLISEIPSQLLRESLENCGGKLLTAEEGVAIAGWGSQMAVQAASHGWLASGQSLHCLGAARQIIPAAKNLESAVLPQEADISAAVRALLN